MTSVFNAQKRSQIGKKSSRKLRRAGKTPGIIYSRGDNAVALEFNSKDLKNFISAGHGLLDLKIQGEKAPQKCVIKDIQLDPVSGEIIHVDLMGVTMGEKLTVTVPIVLTGTPTGVKLGGILEHLVREINVECLPRHIPESIEVDISELGIGDSLHIYDIKAENIEILDAKDETVVHVTAPKAVVETVEEVSEELEETAEPEVITSKKEEEKEGE